MGIPVTMAMSGIMPEMPACEDIYGLVKKGFTKEGDTKIEIRGWTFKFNDKRTMIIPDEMIEKKGDMKEDFEMIAEKAPAKDGMYILWDFEYEDTKSGYNDGDGFPIKRKLLLLTWAPDNAKPAVKMLVPSSVKALTNVMKTVAQTIQCSCVDDLSYESIKTKLGV